MGILSSTIIGSLLLVLYELSLIRKTQQEARKLDSQLGDLRMYMKASYRMERSVALIAEERRLTIKEAVVSGDLSLGLGWVGAVR